MGPLFVENASEGVEAPLLGAKVFAGGTGGFGLLEWGASVRVGGLVGTGGFDQLRAAPELDPMDGKLEDAGDGDGEEGHPVVALDDIEKPVDREETVESA